MTGLSLIFNNLFFVMKVMVRKYPHLPLPPPHPLNLFLARKHFQNLNLRCKYILQNLFFNFNYENLILLQ